MNNYYFKELKFSTLKTIAVGITEGVATGRKYSTTKCTLNLFFNNCARIRSNKKQNQYASQREWRTLA